jgi:hypothetical protein
MGNCLKATIGIESFPLIENSDTIMHNIEVNKEIIEDLKHRLNELEETTNKNLKHISEDIVYLNQKVDHSSLSHQSSSKYGGSSPVSMQDEPDGPFLTSLPISSYDNARR